MSSIDSFSQSSASDGGDDSCSSANEIDNYGGVRIILFEVPFIDPIPLSLADAYRAEDLFCEKDAYVPTSTILTGPVEEPRFIAWLKDFVLRSAHTRRAVPPKLPCPITRHVDQKSERSHERRNEDRTDNLFHTMLQNLSTLSSSQHLCEEYSMSFEFHGGVGQESQCADAPMFVSPGILSSLERENERHTSARMAFQIPLLPEHGRVEFLRLLPYKCRKSLLDRFSTTATNVGDLRVKWRETIVQNGHDLPCDRTKMQILAKHANLQVDDIAALTPLSPVWSSTPPYHPFAGVSDWVVSVGTSIEPNSTLQNVGGSNNSSICEREELLICPSAPQWRRVFESQVQYKASFTGLIAAFEQQRKNHYVSFLSKTFPVSILDATVTNDTLVASCPSNSAQNGSIESCTAHKKRTPANSRTTKAAETKLAIEEESMSPLQLPPPLVPSEHFRHRDIHRAKKPSGSKRSVYLKRRRCEMNTDEYFDFEDRIVPGHVAQKRKVYVSGNAYPYEGSLTQGPTEPSSASASTIMPPDQPSTSFPRSGVSQREEYPPSEFTYIMIDPVCLNYYESVPNEWTGKLCQLQNLGTLQVKLIERSFSTRCIESVVINPWTCLVTVRTESHGSGGGFNAQLWSDGIIRLFLKYKNVYVALKKAFFETDRSFAPGKQSTYAEMMKFQRHCFYMSMDKNLYLHFYDSADSLCNLIGEVVLRHADIFYSEEELLWMDQAKTCIRFMEEETVQEVFLSSLPIFNPYMANNLLSATESLAWIIENPQSVLDLSQCMVNEGALEFWKQMVSEAYP